MSAHGFSVGSTTARSFGGASPRRRRTAERRTRPATRRLGRVFRHEVGNDAILDAPAHHKVRATKGSRGIRASLRCRSPSRRGRMPMSDEERRLRSARVREMVPLPFLLLPRTPSSSLPSLPCADAHGRKSTSLDNARKFHLKFTVADPLCYDERLPTQPSFGIIRTQNLSLHD